MPVHTTGPSVMESVCTTRLEAPMVPEMGNRREYPVERRTVIVLFQGT